MIWIMLSKMKITIMKYHRYVGIMYEAMLFERIGLATDKLKSDVIIDLYVCSTPELFNKRIGRETGRS